MDSLLLVAIWIVLGLSVLGLLSMIGFGLRNVINGKVNPISIIVLALPFVLMGIFGFLLNDWTRAAIITLLCVAVIATLGIIVSSFRSLFA